MQIYDIDLASNERKPGQLPARWWDREALAIANELTLIALTDLGFKHGHGELRIPNEGRALRSVPTVSTGYGNSVAASCMEGH